jgi:ribose/xylose/arabinose/galactoside ABC-type transport system permease subunit
MNLQHGHLGKTMLWGAISAALYAVMFSYADVILHLAHTTPDACVVGQGAEAVYFHKADAAACAARDGRLATGSWWHVLVPIAIALAVSFAHGAFTGLFWDLMGLKPAGHADKNGKERH